jgi:hypothetical protein
MPRSEIPVSGEEVGAEFLTWLWHAGESGEEHVLGKTPVRVILGQLMKLKAPDGSGAEVTVKGEHASTSPELFTALKRGALIVSAKAQLDLNGTVITGTLKAQSVCLGGCKLPKDAGNPDEGAAPRTEKGETPGEHQEVDRNRLEDEARLLTRMGLLDQAQDALDGMFQTFLELRSGKGYPAWRGAFDTWVEKNVKG